MAKEISATPSMLKWARETSGKSLSDVAKAIGRKEKEILDWEQGKSGPTYSILEKLAYQIYKRPLALFFFPDPPAEPTPSKEFRTLPDFVKDNFAADTVLAFRQAEIFQLSLKEMSEGEPETERIFEKFRFSERTDVEKISNEIREYFDVTLNQQKEIRDSEAAFKFWRDKVEDSGVYIFKRSFKQKDISGFCLMDNEFPVVIINNKNSFSRQLFTLFHELAHVLSRISSITDISGEIVNVVVSEFKNIEVACNRFASEFLVPDADFFKSFSGKPEEEKIEFYAELYSVSRELILRKLLDADVVNESFYNKKRQEWNDQLRRGKGKGGNYYATQATYLGDNYLNLAFRNYYNGKISVERLSEFLNVKVKNIPKLEDYVLRR